MYDKFMLDSAEFNSFGGDSLQKEMDIEDKIDEGMKFNQNENE